MLYQLNSNENVGLEESFIQQSRLDVEVLGGSREYQLTSKGIKLKDAALQDITWKDLEGPTWNDLGSIAWEELPSRLYDIKVQEQKFQ